MENAMSGSTSSGRCNISHTHGAKFSSNWTKNWIIHYLEEAESIRNGQSEFLTVHDYSHDVSMCVLRNHLTNINMGTPIWRSGWAGTPQSSALWSLCFLAAIQNLQPFSKPQIDWCLGLYWKGAQHPQNLQTVDSKTSRLKLEALG
jgi:hypothetical protein